VLGYHMVNHVRRKHGPDAWNRVLERTMNFPFIPFSFSRAIRLETGQNVVQTYDSTVAEMQELWQVQTQQPQTAAHISSAPARRFTNYSFPQPVQDGKIVALKSGIGHIEQLVLLDGNGGEKVLHTPGFVNNAFMLSAGGGKVVWNEFGFDPRWSNRNYSIIKVLDLETRKVSSLTKRTRYASAGISPNGKYVVTVENTLQNKYNLHMLDAETGQVVKTFKNPENDFWINPRFADNGENVVAIRFRRGQGKTITVFNVANGTYKDLLPFTNENLGHPVMHGPYVFYNSNRGDADNLYALNTATNEAYKVSSRHYGAYNVAVAAGGKHLLFNDFTPDGMQVAEMPFDPAQWTPLPQAQEKPVNYFAQALEQENNSQVLTNGQTEIDPNQLGVRPYKRIEGLFNIYSWNAFIEPDEEELFIGVKAQDVLSTTAVDVGYQYDANEETGSFVTKLSYQALFPIIELDYELGQRGFTQLVSGRNVDVSWREANTTLGLYLPLNFTNNRYSQVLNIGSSYSINSIRNIRVTEGFTLNNFREGALNAVQHRVIYSRLLKMAKRDIISPWGQSFRLDYRHTTPWSTNFTGRLAAATGNLYFPGLFRHHSLRLRGAFQWIDTDENYTFGSPVLFTRGYDYRRLTRLFNTSVEYRMPLLYPDFSLGPFLYVQRLKTMLFTDIGRGLNGNDWENYQSLGVDLTFDFNVMRWAPIFEAGVRYLYIPETGVGTVSLVLGQFGF